MANHFTEALQQATTIKSGKDRKQAITELGTTLGVIDDAYNVIETENNSYGIAVIISLMESDMSDYGLSLKKIEEQTKNFDDAKKYYEKLIEIGNKYRVLHSEIGKNHIILNEKLKNNANLKDLQEKVNLRFNKICTVREIHCKNIQEAKLLTSEWEEFDKIYSPFDSYADYDSDSMQEVINKIKEKNFNSQHIIDLLSELIYRKYKLEEREQSVRYKKSQQLVKQMLPYAEKNLFVYGSDGFLEKSKTIRSLENVKQQESDVFPLVIYDASDSKDFKGFIVTDKFLYNYNSMWGIGFGDKVISLYDVTETVQNGKNRLFKLSNGKSEKIRMVGHEELIIGMLSEIFPWTSDLKRTQTDTPDVNPKQVNISSDTVSEDKIVCPVCGSQIAANAKFCTFCGNKNIDKDFADNTRPCSNCGKMIKIGVKFCTFCGYSYNN